MDPSASPKLAEKVVQGLLDGYKHLTPKVLNMENQMNQSPNAAIETIVQDLVDGKIGAVYAKQQLKKLILGSKL